jgi:hypothetical protein
VPDPVGHDSGSWRARIVELWCAHVGGEAVHDADRAGVVHAELASGEAKLEGLEAAGLERLAIAGGQPGGADFAGHIRSAIPARAHRP